MNFTIKYSVISGLIFLSVAIINLSGTGHSYEYFRYITSLLVGSISGFFIGRMKDSWIPKMAELEQTLSHRKKIKQNLIDQGQILAVTLRRISEGVITTDYEGKVVVMNQLAEQLTGWNDKKTVNKPIAEIFKIYSGEIGDKCENPVKKVLSTKQIIHSTNHTVLLSGNGNQFIIEYSVAPLLDRENHIIGTVLVFRDVTTEKEIQEELLKAKKLESVSVLAGSISHDFNNILMVVLGNINLARTYINEENEAYILLQEAEKSIVQASDLIQKLSAFSKGGEPVKKTIAIDKIITDSVNVVIHGSAIICRFDIPKNLWMVDVNKGQLIQVIQNIVKNACEAMPHGGQMTISCANVFEIVAETGLSATKGKFIRIILQDRGCGIPEKYRDKIFNPYFSTKEGGSGLGLAVARLTIQKHGGRIFVSTDISNGTTVTIYLPAAKRQAILPSEKKKHLRQAKILLMDDEPLIQDLAKKMLSRLGYDVLTAADGKETIELFKEHQNSGRPIDLIIMDLTIPGGMGGRETADKILQIDPDAKVIVSSGLSIDPVMTHYHEYGFTAAISKPFRLSELKEKIRYILD